MLALLPRGARTALRLRCADAVALPSVCAAPSAARRCCSRGPGFAGGGDGDGGGNAASDIDALLRGLGGEHSLPAAPPGAAPPGTAAPHSEILRRGAPHRQHHQRPSTAQQQPTPRHAADPTRRTPARNAPPAKRSVDRQCALCGGSREAAVMEEMGGGSGFYRCKRGHETPECSPERRPAWMKHAARETAGGPESWPRSAKDSAAAAAADPMPHSTPQQPSPGAGDDPSARRGSRAIDELAKRRQRRNDPGAKLSNWRNR